MVAGRTLAVDVGVANLGWACGGPVGLPQHGLIRLPGTKDMRKLLLGARNEVEALVERHEPDTIRFVPIRGWGNPLNMATEDGMHAIQGVLYLVAGDHGLAVTTADERTVRKAVLGKCDFGRKNPKTGRMIAGAGREEAKALVMEWARIQGYKPISHDVADSLCLWHWDQMQRHGRKATRPTLMLSGAQNGRG